MKKTWLVSLYRLSALISGLCIIVFTNFHPYRYDDDSVCVAWSAFVGFITRYVALAFHTASYYEKAVSVETHRLLS